MIARLVGWGGEGMVPEGRLEQVPDLYPFSYLATQCISKMRQQGYKMQVHIAAPPPTLFIYLFSYVT